MTVTTAQAPPTAAPDAKPGADAGTEKGTEKKELVFDDLPDSDGFDLLGDDLHKEVDPQVSERMREKRTLRSGARSPTHQQTADEVFTQRAMLAQAMAAVVGDDDDGESSDGESESDKLHKCTSALTDKQKGKNLSRMYSQLDALNKSKEVRGKLAGGG